MWFTATNPFSELSPRAASCASRIVGLAGWPYYTIKSRYECDSSSDPDVSLQAFITVPRRFFHCPFSVLSVSLHQKWAHF